MRLVLDGLAVTLDGRSIVRGADLVVEPGELTGLVGPNGSGKSTLIRAAYRALRPAAGLITVGGDDLVRLPPRESARRIAVVAQENPAELDFTVEDVVLMGRTPHKRPLSRTTAEDLHRCAESLERVDLGHAARRSYATLSGGEKQRVLIARALVQGSRLLLLDEPTTHLDIRHQLDVLHLVRELGITALAALHDLNQATEFCDRIYVMDGGRIVADALTPEVITRVFGVRAVPRTQYAFERLKEDP
ncbi:ABC transporter ATP-binding protein [Acrocarpospora phusangensis]|uniref:ABC transporter ATP-binding protein n=1 Tax=Acrocarpospora phusangensis TaxID=1070424 RepID=A0A919Q724_9ACTN|nr:ABC transporter ATP-binding protein [Acrocarpospora phusangensis]GIH23512.1 ABC transporter ATP-binding protein [Acrocarpospora phusangensis]